MTTQPHLIGVFPGCTLCAWAFRHYCYGNPKSFVFNDPTPPCGDQISRMLGYIRYGVAKRFKI